MVLWLNNMSILLWALTKFLGLIFLVLALVGLILVMLYTIVTTIDENKRWK